MRKGKLNMVSVLWQNYCHLNPSALSPKQNDLDDNLERSVFC